jgi:hypothetical protein
MIKTRHLFLVVSLLLMMSACDTQKAPQVEGNYTYEHAFSYDMEGNHFDVSETGTMDFYADGTALDSARQVYTVTLADGDTVTWVYNYISPSRWRVDGDTLFFAGVKEGFRMEVIENENQNQNENENIELAQKIIGMYSNSIDYEYQFHLDTLTKEKLQWSFTYRDGHSDTWQFYRK